MKLEDLKKEVVEAIVNCSVMTGFENHGDVHDPELVKDIMTRFNMVETGIIQGLSVDQLISTVEKAIACRRGGQLIDIWKEICNGVNKTATESWGEEILTALRSIETEGFLDVPKTVTGKGMKFTTVNGIIDGAQRRYNGFVQAVNAGNNKMATKAEKEFFLILRDYPIHQKDIIDRSFGDFEVNRLKGISNKRDRFTEVQIQFNKVRDDKIRKDPVTSVNTLDEIDYRVLPTVQTVEEIFKRIKLILEDTSLNHHVKTLHISNMVEQLEIRMEILLQMFPGTGDYLKTLDSSKLMNGVGVWVKDRIHLNDIDKFFPVKEPEVKVKVSAKQPWVIFPNVANIDPFDTNLHLSVTEDMAVLNALIQGIDLYPWSSVKFETELFKFVSLIQMACDQEKLVKHMFPRYSEDLDHFSPEERGRLIVGNLLQTWICEHARAKQPSNLNTQTPFPIQQEVNMNPQQDFAKSVFLDVLKSNNPAFADYDIADGEHKEILESVFEAMYNNFVKPTLFKLNQKQTSTETSQKEVRQIQLPGGQTVQIKGPKNDPMLDQLVGMFSPRPKTKISNYRHVINFAALNLEHCMVFNETAKTFAIQVIQPHAFNHPSGTQTVLNGTVLNFAAAEKIFDSYKETLRMTAEVHSAAQAAAHTYYSIGNSGW